MKMKQCPSGHFYNAESNKGCPYCQGAGRTRPLAGQPLAATSAIRPGVGDTQETGAFPKTLPLGTEGTEGAIPPTMPLAGDIQATLPLAAVEGGIAPTIAWLVCIEGKKRGRDYRICTDHCYIGRGQSNDLSLEFDSTISRDTHLLLAYNRMDRTFWLDVSQSKNNIYLEKQLVLQPVPLQRGDTITLGQTSLLFVPLCGPDFSWE